ncbi:MAG: adenylate/guanylate cyclase domain-containing protein [SAR324 cluster bacterium]|uniref:Adenylate/guanylate cyclase domain-containing protein n=1 Tax=SAR324 cluster bacterium TaxID=2024889 RepID=A0A432GQ76_9DELT|nr:MAG: adenylate/guanylate cyclase domain-containing protein [SAR324 cluster bacterium]
MERKLSTIFASDVVGYSKMMGNNEEKTLEILGERREVIDSAIADYNGIIFGSAGDSVIAEFGSPVKATECAVQIQGKMKTMNEDIPVDQQMIFRIGINIGDVMVSKDNLFGDAVNVAARLESAAQPSGICVSKTVFDLINQKIRVSFEDAGKLDLKNIVEPIQAYFVIQKKGGVRFNQYEDSPQIKVEKAEQGSLAVMLFKNLSKDEDQAYFCEGFSEDLITVLSKYSKLLVVSGNASFTYRDKSKSPKEIGKELGVRYILEGSVRKPGQKVRIGAKLISADRENTIWSHNFDFTIDEMFDIQDELVETIVSTIVGHVDDEEVKQLVRIKPENHTAYDLVLQGLEYHRKSNVTSENAKKAVEFFDQAIEVDPNCARAHAWRACSLSNYVGWRPDEYGEDWIDQCADSVIRSLEIDQNDHEAHRSMGAISLVRGDFELARHHQERAMELCPSDAYIMGKNAALLVYLGEPEKALEIVQHAMRINPFCPDDLFVDEGMCYFWLGKYSEAVNCFRKMKTPDRESIFYLTASLSKLGEGIKSAETLKQAFKMTDLSVEDFLLTQHYQNPELKQELREILESIPI